MSTPIQRASLPDQAAAVLKSGITAARWARELPSEATLCRELHVSRDTVRKALAQLIRERWITAGGRGCHHRIRRRATTAVKTTGRTIRILSPIAHSGLGNVQHVALETLTERVTAEGCRLEFEHWPQLARSHQPGLLQRLDALPDTAGWILFYSSEATQRWFAARQRPCVVAGPLYQGIVLSSVCPDTLASTRHAVGRFYARGCRELIYFITPNTSLGVIRGSVIFVDEARRLGAKARILEHPEDAPALRRVIRQLLAERPRPDGFFSAHAGHAVTALCCLLEAGLRVPSDAAIIAGWDDVFLDYTIPTLSRYRIDGTKFGRKLALTILDQLRHGPGKMRTVRILPEFVRGDTI